MVGLIQGNGDLLLISGRLALLRVCRAGSGAAAGWLTAHAPAKKRAEEIRETATLAEEIPQVVDLNARGAAAHPAEPLAWASLGDAAREAGEPDITVYAYYRVGYHRGLDALRKAGWRGQGPVPWSHEPNRGVLRCFWLLRRAAEDIGEAGEVERLDALLRDADPTAADAIAAESEGR